MRIDVWSDVICPWCAIGRKRLHDALAATGNEAEIVHRAFELDPHRTGTEPSMEMLEAKYGPQAGDMADRVRAIAQGEGIELRTREALAANTFDVHRLILWAQAAGKGEAMMDALVHAHFKAAADIGQHDVLLAAAAACGMDATALLAGQEWTEQVRTDEKEAHALGIRGVPFFVFDGHLAVSGAQPADAFVQAIRQTLALAEKAVE